MGWYNSTELDFLLNVSTVPPLYGTMSHGTVRIWYEDDTKNRSYGHKVCQIYTSLSRQS
jgi:hypothetical protein